jgi:hypothetical protein
MIYDLILNYSLDSEIANSLWNILQEMINKLNNSQKVVFYNKFNDYNTNKKQIKWYLSKPQVNLYNLNELTSGKKNLFSTEEIELISTKKIMQMSPSDLGLILPSILENNIKLLDVMICFLQTTKELTQDTIRRDIIINQFKKMEKTTLYLSAYGLDFLLYLLERSSEENEYKILTSYIWDENIWKLNYVMTHKSYLNFFDIINNNTSIEWKDLKILLLLPTSIESKIATLIYAYKNGVLMSSMAYYWDANPKLMLEIITNKNFNFKSPTLIEFIDTKIEQIVLKNEILQCNIYASYLFNSENIDKILLNKNTFLTFNSDNSNVELQEILTHFLQQIKTIKDIHLYMDDHFTEIKIMVDEFVSNDIFSLIIKNSRLISPLKIEYSVCVNKHCFQYRFNKFFYGEDYHKYIYIKIDKVPIELIKWIIYFK